MLTSNTFLKLMALVIIVSQSMSCLKRQSPGAIGADQCSPDGAALAMPATSSEYARLCSNYVGVVPKVDCRNGVPIPIFTNGVEAREDQPAFACDKHDSKGRCAVGSRLGRIEGLALDGTPLPEVVWVFFCKSHGMEAFEAGSVEVQLIGHNKKTGATCFFESPDAVGSSAQAKYLSFDSNNLLVGELPGPSDPDFDTAFIPPPEGRECSGCHQGDPFIHNPWIDSARLSEDPTEPVVPETKDPNSPYFIVGGGGWDMRTIHIEGNGCVGCHRAPMNVSEFLESAAINVNSFMPPASPGSMAADYEALINCHQNGPESTPGCSWEVPIIKDCQ